MSERSASSGTVPPGLRTPWIWIQPKDDGELLSRLRDAMDLAVPDRERENLCSVAFDSITRLRDLKTADKRSDPIAVVQGWHGSDSAPILKLAEGVASLPIGTKLYSIPTRLYEGLSECADAVLDCFFDRIRDTTALESMRMALQNAENGLRDVDYTEDVGADIRKIECHAIADDLGVARFAAAMKEELARKRDEGRHGWNNLLEIEDLSEMLNSAVDDSVNGERALAIGNYAMMLFNRRNPLGVGVVDGVIEFPFPSGSPR